MFILKSDIQNWDDYVVGLVVRRYWIKILFVIHLKEE